MQVKVAGFDICIHSEFPSNDWFIIRFWTIALSPECSTVYTNGFPCCKIQQRMKRAPAYFTSNWTCERPPSATLCLSRLNLRSKLFYRFNWVGIASWKSVADFCCEDAEHSAWSNQGFWPSADPRSIDLVYGMAEVTLVLMVITAELGFEI